MTWKARENSFIQCRRIIQALVGTSKQIKMLRPFLRRKQRLQLRLSLGDKNVLVTVVIERENRRLHLISLRNGRGEDDRDALDPMSPATYLLVAGVIRVAIVVVAGRGAAKGINKQAIVARHPKPEGGGFNP